MTSPEWHYADELPSMAQVVWKSDCENAVDSEREACALLVEEMALSLLDSTTPTGTVRSDLAAAIRGRVSK